MNNIKSITFPAVKNDGTLVQLDEILSLIPENRWIWSFIEFSGMGKAPQNLSMQEFENEVISRKNGYLMSWHELIDFSHLLNQTIDCTLVAVKMPDEIFIEEILHNNFHKCEMVIQAFDSTDWSVLAKNQKTIDALSILTTY